MIDENKLLKWMVELRGLYIRNGQLEQSWAIDAVVRKVEDMINESK